MGIAKLRRTGSEGINKQLPVILGIWKSLISAYFMLHLHLAGTGWHQVPGTRQGYIGQFPP